MPSHPTPPFHRLQLYAYGTWKRGGQLTLTHPTLQEAQTVEVPPVTFAVLAMLIRNVLANGAGKSVFKSQRAFVSMESLLHALKENFGTNTRRDLTRQSVAKLIWRLRQLFADVLDPSWRKKQKARGGSSSPGTPAWTKALVVNSPALGYRLAIPAKDLKLAFSEQPGGIDKEASSGIWMTGERSSKED